MSTDRQANGRDRTCCVAECIRPVHGHGWCHKHYQRWRRYGDPLAAGVGQGRRPLLEVCRKGHDKTDPANLYTFKRKDGTIGTKCRKCHDATVNRRHKERRRYAALRGAA